MRGAQGNGHWYGMLGTISGAVCLIHCLAMPFVVGAVILLPRVGGLMHGMLEPVMVGLTLLLAWISISGSYHVHRRRLPLLLLLGGTLLSVVAQTLHGPDHEGGLLIGIVGTILLVSSIWINRALLRQAVPSPPAEPLAVKG